MAFVGASKHGEHIAMFRRELEYAPSFHRDFVSGVATYAHELFSAIDDLDTVYVPIGLGSGGIDTVHPLSGREIRALRQLRRENTESRYVFVTERGGPATTAGFLKTISRTGEAAKLSFPVHPHMLRHSTG
jgi:hypothetical protein